MSAYELADKFENRECWDEVDAVLWCEEAVNMIRKLADENKQLKDFVKPILVHGGDGVGDWDGYELQELAVRSGLFISKTMNEPCNLGKEEETGCLCREYCYGEEEWECYRIAKLLLDEEK